MTVKEYAEKLRAQTIGGETESGRMLAEALTSQYGDTVIPEGFDVVAYRMPRAGDMVLYNDGRVGPAPEHYTNRSYGARLILKQKPKLVGWTVRILDRPPLPGEKYTDPKGDLTKFQTSLWPRVQGSQDSTFNYTNYRAVSIEPIYE